MTYQIVKKSAYRAIGMKWEGSWSDIIKLKRTIQLMNERKEELKFTIDSDTQLGLSYHTRPDGFVHYSVYEVSNQQEIPEGMVEIIVPEYTYIVFQHEKGQNIGQSYANIYRWLQENNYMPYVEPSVSYYDELPIKHERYPENRDLTDPHFEILIPIIKK